MIPAENNTSSTHVTDMVKTVFWDCKAKLLEVLPAKTFSVEKFTVVPIKIRSSVLDLWFQKRNRSNHRLSNSGPI